MKDTSRHDWVHDADGSHLSCGPDAKPDALRTSRTCSPVRALEVATILVVALHQLIRNRLVKRVTLSI